MRDQERIENLNLSHTQIKLKGNAYGVEWQMSDFCQKSNIHA